VFQIRNRGFFGLDGSNPDPAIFLTDPDMNLVPDPDPATLYFKWILLRDIQFTHVQCSGVQL
jgi:hypothetical protein